MGKGGIGFEPSANPQHGPRVRRFFEGCHAEGPVLSWASDVLEFEGCRRRGFASIATPTALLTIGGALAAAGWWLQGVGQRNAWRVTRKAETDTASVVVVGAIAIGGSCRVRQRTWDLSCRKCLTWDSELTWWCCNACQAASIHLPKKSRSPYTCMHIHMYISYTPFFISSC